MLHSWISIEHTLHLQLIWNHWLILVRLKSKAYSQATDLRAMNPSVSHLSEDHCCFRWRHIPLFNTENRINECLTVVTCDRTSRTKSNHWTNISSFWSFLVLKRPPKQLQSGTRSPGRVGPRWVMRSARRALRAPEGDEESSVSKRKRKETRETPKWDIWSW